MRLLVYCYRQACSEGWIYILFYVIFIKYTNRMNFKALYTGFYILETKSVIGIENVAWGLNIKVTLEI